jgi:hypothetical protein
LKESYNNGFKDANFIVGTVDETRSAFRDHLLRNFENYPPKFTIWMAQQGHESYHTLIPQSAFLELSPPQFLRYLIRSPWWSIEESAVIAYGEAHPGWKKAILRCVALYCIFEPDKTFGLFRRWGAAFALRPIHIRHFYRISYDNHMVQDAQKTVLSFLDKWCAYSSTPPDPTVVSMFRGEDSDYWLMNHYPDVYVATVVNTWRWHSVPVAYCPVFDKLLEQLPEGKERMEILRQWFFSFAHPQRSVPIIYENFGRLVEELKDHKCFNGISPQAIPDSVWEDTKLARMAHQCFSEQYIRELIESHRYTAALPRLWSDDFKYAYDLSRTHKSPELDWFRKLRKALSS